MARKKITYGQLDRALKALGFTRRFVAKEPPAVRYEHPGTGALVSVPPFDDADVAMEHHLAAARMALDQFGIAEPDLFADELQRAG